jgi:hypothetical protein
MEIILGNSLGGLCTFMISRSVLLRIRFILDKIENKIKTRVFSKFPPENYALYGRMWGKYGTGREDTGDNIIRLVHFHAG